MKKVKFIVILCSILMFGVQSVHAQLFRDHEIRWFSSGNGTRGDDGEDPGGGSTGEEPIPDPNDPTSPIGSGVAILLGCATLYACTRRKKEN